MAKTLKTHTISYARRIIRGQLEQERRQRQDHAQDQYVVQRGQASAPFLQRAEPDVIPIACSHVLAAC